MELQGNVAGLIKLLGGGEGSTVVVNPIIDSGNHIADISVDGVAYSIYSPEGFSGNYNDLSNKPTLAAVASSGSYNDLSNKPSINGEPLQGDVTVSSEDNYSTTEHVVCTWIDGRPLYEKSIQFGAISDQNYSLDLGLLSSEIDICLFVPGGSYINHGTLPIPYVHGIDNNSNIGGFINYNNVNVTFDFRIGQNSAGYITDGIITIRYVKKVTS